MSEEHNEAEREAILRNWERRIMEAHEAAGGNRNGKMPAMVEKESTTSLQRLADRLYDAADNLDARAALSSADLLGASVIMRIVDEKPGREAMSKVEKLARAMCDVHHRGEMQHVWEVYVPLAQKAIDMLAADEKPTPVTDSEKLADQMARDILSEDVLKPKDRPVVRKALDEADGRTKSKDVSESVWRRATGRYEPGAGGAMTRVG